MFGESIVGVLKQIGMIFFILSIGIVFGFGQENVEVKTERINGVSMVSINGEIDSSNVLPLTNLGANWAAAIPFAFMPSHTVPQLSFDLEWQWKAERIEGTRNYIKELHAQGIAVMVKPQIWIGRGTYTGEIKMNSEEDWITLEQNYEKYLVAFAELSAEEHVEMLCIGTELKHFVTERPNFWIELIKKLRGIYQGKLTYAANWDEYDNVPFWAEVDYIGIDAYFPVTKKKRASIAKLEKGWKPHKLKMDTIAHHYGRPIIFTEYGYRSVSHCAMKPWDYTEGGKHSEKAQQIALEALFNVFWKDEDFVGGFLWKWHPDHERAGGPGNTMFTVQNKKGAKIVEQFYSM